MARAAFVMDGFMTKVGLHGRSVVPLMSVLLVLFLELWLPEPLKIGGTA